eukprot:7329549-Prymnesium_polylepis.1
MHDAAQVRNRRYKRRLHVRMECFVRFETRQQQPDYVAAPLSSFNAYLRRVRVAQGAKLSE